MKSFLTALLAACLLLCAGAWAESQPSFSQGEPHASSEFGLYFETMSCAQGATTLSIPADSYEEEKARTLWEIVCRDLAVLCEKTGIAPEQLSAHTVYVVDKLVNGSIERVENRVYCRAQHVESGAYRPLLICAALGCEDYWVGVGLAGYLFGQQADAAFLQDYYARAEQLDILSLSVPYFVSDFADKEEIAAAKQTAVSLCSYVLETYGCAALLEGDGVVYRREWLQKLGVNREYDDPCAETLREYRFRASAKYALIAEDSLGHTIYLSPVQDMATALEARMFLHDMIAGPQEIIRWVEENAPEYAQSVRSQYEGALRIYCGEGESGSYARPEYREIRLALASGCLHELGHILIQATQDANYYTTMWQYEGLCNYLINTVYQPYAWKEQHLAALELFWEMDNPQKPTHRFMCRAVEIYKKHAKYPQSLEQVDVALYRHAMALVPEFFPEEAEGAAWAASVHSSYSGTRNENGNELTYEQAYSLTDYLIREHSLSAFLRYCVENESFEQAFGAPYEEVRSTWLNELRERLL